MVEGSCPVDACLASVRIDVVSIAVGELFALVVGSCAFASAATTTR